MLEYISGWAHTLWACGPPLCWTAGVAALLGLAAWLASIAVASLRSRRLLDRLPQRAVLITGCDSGFGAALARRLDALGVPVFAGCLLPEGPGARQLAEDCSSRLRVLPLDVTSDEQVSRALEQVEGSLVDSELWAVVNNAGVLDAGEAELIPLDVYRRALDVNALGVIRVSQAALPLLRRSRGRLITVASPLGRTSMPMLSPYCLSKSAAISYCDSLRVEMSKWGVSVCTVEPTSYTSDLNNPDHFEVSISGSFQKCPVRVRESYGENYHVKCQDQLAFLTCMAKSRDHIGEVVDELVDACVGHHFQVKRIPGLKEKVMYTVLPRLPNYTKDFIRHLLFQRNLTTATPEAST